MLWICEGFAKELKPVARTVNTCNVKLVLCSFLVLHLPNKAYNFK